MKKLVLAIIIFLVFTCGKGQTVFYQDVFHGGITADGFTTTLGSGTGFINVSISSGSIIKKAFLFCGRHGEAEPITILFEGNPIEFNSQNIVSSPFLSPFYAGANGMGYVHCVEVDNLVNPSVNSYQINIPNQLLTNERFTDFYLIIVYENLTLSKSNISILINDNDIDQYVTYQSNNLNPINNSFDVGMAIHGGYMCDTIVEPTLVYFDGNYLGKIGGNDYNNSAICGGVVGSFNYEQNTLEGLGDDIANSQVAASDGLANIMNLLSNNSKSVNVLFQVQAVNSIHYSTNPVWSVSFTYTTPCDTFTAAVNADTVVCMGESVQLQATGGQAYEWLPQTGLSCYTCPNPTFVGDSTTHYTVRIWNTDSCSVVYPVRVTVLPSPQSATLTATPTACGDTTGSITVSGATGGTPPYTYSIGTGAQSNPQFQNLSQGQYYLTLTDSNGCILTDSAYVAEEIQVNASFTATPQEGIAPLAVIFTNTSTGATHYTWYINGDTLYSTHSNYTFDTAGAYVITLIAYNNHPACADTTYLTIHVYDEVSLVAPNIFTPNGDGNNDFFTVQTRGITQLSATIYNRWGAALWYVELQPGNGTNQVQLWDGRTIGSELASEGAYYYSIEAQGVGGEIKQFGGTVYLVR
ncbi:MAG: gliding motility-associated C-terminal domain-containing protein [Flavobacteriales bacterium]